MDKVKSEEGAFCTKIDGIMEERNKTKTKDCKIILRKLRYENKNG